MNERLLRQYLATRHVTERVINDTLVTEQTAVSGVEFVEGHRDPMFSRCDSTLLLRVAETMRGCGPEPAHEMMRHFFEKSGERGERLTHYVIVSGPRIHETAFMVEGWHPRTPTTLALSAVIDTLTRSHCSSTVLRCTTPPRP